MSPAELDPAGWGGALHGLAAWCGAALGEGRGVIAALALAGLAGGLTHCVGMCGPLVLGQVARQTRGGGNEAGGGRIARFAGAALLPYHLGRAVTYTALGAVAGGLGGAALDGLRQGWVAAALLALAAALLLAQAAGIAGLAHAPGGAVGRALGAVAARLAPAARQGGRGRFALGAALGFLPCGLVYGALVAAAASGGAWAGAGGMAAFALGTMPGLVAVALTGHGLALRAGAALRTAAVGLLIVNAGTVATLAAAAAS